MFKKMIFVIGFLGIVIFSLPLGYAETGNPSVYKVTVQRIELSADGGTTYTTVFSGSSELDIASANAGQVAGNFVSDIKIADGLYNRLRVTISATFKIKGSVVLNADNRRYYTLANGTASLVAANEVEATITAPVNISPTGTFTSVDTVSITVANGKSGVIRVAFDTQGTINLLLAGGTFFPGAPVVTTTQL